MPKLSPISHARFVKKLKQAGYISMRKSKHIIYFHPEKQITIPFSHKHQTDISKGFLNRLVKEMRISVEEFNKL